MEAREKLNEFAELRGWNKNKPIGWSEAADFGEWLVKNNAKLQPVSSLLRFSEHEIDFAYLCGVFNTSGIDGLHKEIQRLKELGKEPHDIIEACRKQ